MKPVLIQHLIKNNRRKISQEPVEKPVDDNPLATFVFWGIVAIVLLSLFLA